MNINDFSALSFAYFEFSIGEIENFLRKDIENDLESQRISLTKNVFNIEQYFSGAIDKRNPQKKPYAKPTLEAFFYSPSSSPEKTIMVSNMRDGWIQLCRVLSKTLKCRYYYFLMDDDLFDEPGNYFESGDGVSTRTVYAIKEDKWVFCSIGDAVSIEDVQHYKKRNIKDRLNKQILIEYCQKLDLSIFDDNFWQSESEGLRYVIG